LSEFNLILLLVGLVISLFATLIAAFGLCGPTWFQRTGLCFAVLSIAQGVFASDIQPEMTIVVLKPVLEGAAVIFSMIGTVIAAFGEVIWCVLHKKGGSAGEIIKKYVNS
jgi:hypothetical protein